MKRVIFLIVFFSYIDASWALNERRELPLQDGTTRVRTVYGEDGRFFVDTYSVGSDGWQERTAQKSFATADLAKKYFARVTRAYPNISTLKNRQFVKPRTATVVWEATNEWNAEWEAKYTEWVRANLDDHFYEKYQIPTDCADVAFSIRWIYSRINSLPAAATLAGSEQLFTQRDGKASWASIPTADNWYEDQRFRTALLYVMENTYTHSLIEDSYPVEISPLGVQPGGYHLTLRTESGHTRVIYSTKPNGSALHVIRFVASDVPAEVRILHEEPFSLKKYLPEGDGGFLRFRWPYLNPRGQYILTAPEQMPNYSLEQFGEEFKKSYYNAVIKQMGVSNKPDEFIRLRLELVWQKLNYRVDIVKKGFAFCGVEDCSPGTAGYEDWGTPNRDLQIYELVEEIWDTYLNSNDPKVDAEFKKWENLTLDLGDESGLVVTYRDLLDIWYYQYYSYDPRDGILRRWGY